MKVLVLYRPNSEHERRVLDFVRDFERQTSKALEMVSLDTVDGASKARVYDITQYPAVMALDDNGSVLKLWMGEHLPLINEVSAFARDGGSFVENANP